MPEAAVEQVRIHPNIAVVIPAHNEAESIGAVVRGIIEQYPFPVFVVDDYSSDDTREQAGMAGALVLPLSSRLGAWLATQMRAHVARHEERRVAHERMRLRLWADAREVQGPPLIRARHCKAAACRSGINLQPTPNC